MAHETERKPTSITQQSHNLVEEQIRYRAYELYEARGAEPGHELDDWLRAEDEVRRKVRTTAA